MRALKIIGLSFLVLMILNEFANAYNEIGWDAIFIIIPFAIIIAIVIYFRKRNKRYKNKI